jgi:hypothetical protein
VIQPDTISVSQPSEHRTTETTPEFSVLRIKHPKRGWVPIPRALIDDSRLQFDTRAIANWLIAKPDGWHIRLVALPYLLQQRAGPNERMGRDRVRRMLRELENAGYLTRARSKKPDVRWVWYVELSDTPAPLHRSPTIDGSAVDGSATDGSAVDGQGVDLLNTLNNSRVDKTIPTTTTEPKPTENAVVVVPLMEVQIPDILQGAYLTRARKLIEACPPAQRQAVFDEIGAMHARGKVRSPLGLLRSLSVKAKQGEFTPNYSLRVDQNSSSKSQTAARRPKPSTQPQSASGPLVPVSEIADRTIGELRERFKPDGG